MNKIILIGNIGHTPELKQASDKVFLRFTLAVKNPYSDQTDWFNCVSFGKQAETIAKFFTKGSKIAIVGRVQTGTYEGKDGTKKTKFDIIVESFDFCDSGRTSGENQKEEARLPFADIEDAEDEDLSLPF